jgi:hypothetical protein
MKLPKLPKLDLFPGTDQDGVIVLIIALALGFVASQGWRESAWVQAAGTAGPAAGGVIYGKRKGEKEGWEKGFNTLNPALHVDEILSLQQSGFRGDGPDEPGLVEQMAGRVVQGVAAGVAEQVVDAGVEQVMERFAPEPEVMPVVDPAPKWRARLDEVQRLKHKNVQQLKRMARERGMGGSWLSTARKDEIIRRLVKG